MTMGKGRRFGQGVEITLKATSLDSAVFQGRKTRDP